MSYEVWGFRAVSLVMLFDAFCPSKILCMSVRDLSDRAPQLRDVAFMREAVTITHRFSIEKGVE